MANSVNNSEIYVRDYTSNFSVKQFIQDVLIPKAFPDIPVNKLNLGFTGVTSELISQAIEDSYGTASLMMNEAFITRSILPNSIYSAASLFDLGYTFATPSRCKFAMQLWLDDIIKYSQKVRNTTIYRYILDKNTKLILGDSVYRFDYDIIIDHQFIDGQRVFNIYYNKSNTEINSIAIVDNIYIKHQVSSIGWIALFVELQEFDRKISENIISDNLITVNSDIPIRWSRQIAGFDLVYISPTGDKYQMNAKNLYTPPEQNPFAWYRFENDNLIKLSFSNNKGFFQPQFNSKILSTIYTCRGLSANFDSYDRKTAVPVQKTGERYEYNASTKMVALCYSGSKGGLDRADIELLRKDIISAYNTAKVITTDNDLKLWFDRYAVRYGTKSEFFKRRDDFSGRLFSQFIAITDNTYVYPTNTLTIDVDQNQFDFINSDKNGLNKEFIIKPGHLWEYADYIDENNKKVIVRDRVRMVKGIDKMAMITDDALPPITSDRPFMFVNPFFIKLHRSPSISANYNSLIIHTSWPEDIPIGSESFHQFQLATFSVERTLSKKSNSYNLQVICVPVITTDKNIKYVEGIDGKNDETFPVYDNNIRIILVTRSKTDGETGYIEMIPKELRNGGAILFESEISVHDNLRSDMMLEIDQENTPDIRSLISSGVREGKIFIDSDETSFHFIILMKDSMGKATSILFNDPKFQGYLMANRFANDHRNLTLYQPMTMMRSAISFVGENNNYKVRASMIPFLRWDVPLDNTKMDYFIRAFNEQYHAMSPVVSLLDGNSSIDMKLFNTYGRSSNYYIGPSDDSEVLWDSDILLDNVYVRIKFRMAVNDRSIYTQTVEAVVNEIQGFFESMNSGSLTDIHVSDLIHIIKTLFSSSIENDLKNKEKITKKALL